MCAVRALTEGDPVAWWPKNEGDFVSGLVLRKGEVTTDFGQIPFVDLWQGGHQRVRIMAYSGRLRHALDQAAPQVGDRLSVSFDGTEPMPAKSKMAGQLYKKFSANVQRGH